MMQTKLTSFWRLAALGLIFTPALAQEADAPAYFGHPSVDGGACCQTLSEVRGHIDEIDGAIIAAMAERQKYVNEAARFKKDPAAVAAPARVDAIIADVRRLAQAHGLSPEVADRTFRAMIGGFEDYERAEWIKRQEAH